ncbi:hypothetical protein D8674_004804 [Pyrus ussuriensis x Pyrus communis]|uniref:Uncharacterized protein n=1 Tax=Pyrus ussuriensis x Pyrus communis TaxID=2448454 RepID=A0A5N5FQA4_9ROSA|nr:hypothetical protein D8674_004804 [Pyrus ussuriensis x Pyrus communis]
MEKMRERDCESEIGASGKGQSFSTDWRPHELLFFLPPDDVAVDAEGNAYVTDCTASKIWKVGADGKLLSTIRSPLLRAKEWYKNSVGLNEIVCHPDCYLIVIHTFSGKLLKIDLAKGEEVKLIEVAGGPLTFGDGRALLSPTKLVVAGNPSGRLVASSNGWETASVVPKFSGIKHRLATAAIVKTHESWTHRSFTTAICRLDVGYGVFI